MQPSQGWVRGLWKSLEPLPLWLFEPCSPPGLYNSAPAHEKQETIRTHQIQQECSRKMKHAVEELTCPKWTLAASKPPTCSLFLKRSNGYVIVLLITPAPLPQIRLCKFPWRQDKQLQDFKLHMSHCCDVQKHKLELHWPPEFRDLGCGANSFLKTL